jgi:hypothetical protein
VYAPAWVTPLLHLERSTEMLIEKNVALAAGVIATAIIVPECIAVSRHAGAISGFTLVIGATIGAVGVFLGCSIASTMENRPSRLGGLLVWAFVGVGLSVCLGISALHEPQWWRLVLFIGFAILPFGGCLAVLIPLRRLRA